jgi:CrcB protein
MAMIWVGLGGFVGAISRNLMVGLVSGLFGNNAFPAGTLSVNVLGSFIFGLLSALIEHRTNVPPEVQGFIFIGLLGGFTTFSTFSNEILNLFRGGQEGLALAYMAGSLALGIGAIWLGLKAGQLWA